MTILNRMKFSFNFFAILQNILCEAKSFEELANINIGFIEKRNAFIQNSNRYEEDSDGYKFSKQSSIESMFCFI